jgi:hypothetical protein
MTTACGMCASAQAARRGLCWSCHRKLRECGVAMPAPKARGPEAASPESRRDALRSLLVAALARLGRE